MSDRQHTLSRREFLAPLAFAPLWRAASYVASAAPQARDPAIRPAPFSSLRASLTPNEDFFIRDHFTPPRSVLPAKLRVTGRVHSPFEITYAELTRQPTRTLAVTLECAGNGVGSGGVSTATWEGVPLVTFLKRAGLGSSVKYIRLVGADRGIEGTAASIHFARSIPLDKALRPDTLIAFRMNGVPLPTEHGYPWRAIVPGWYGMDSVKWLAGIEVLDRADASYFMTQRYIAVRLRTIGAEQRAVTRMRVKSLILDPLEGTIMAPGKVAIRGRAWAGENRVARVEVSTDTGKSWAAAKLDKDYGGYAWVMWNYPWEVRAPGVYVLMARATDDQGNTQPPARDHLRFDDYEQNGYQSVRCEIR